MQRRDFLRTMLAAAVAPAFVPASRLMRVKPIVRPGFWDGLVAAFRPMSPDEVQFRQVLMKFEKLNRNRDVFGFPACEYRVAQGTWVSPQPMVITIHADMNKYILRRPKG